MRWQRLALMTAGALAGATAAAITIGSARWRRGTDGFVGRLAVRLPAGAPPTFTGSELEGLPEPVARYFRNVLVPGRPRIASARLVQQGDFRLGVREESWRPFEAVQHVAATPPGFVWDARIHVAPLVTVRVRDAYAHGVGSMQAALLGVVPLVNEQAKPQLTEGALQRYLAEAPWVPTVLLPGGAVTWSPIDQNRALATIRDASTTVSLEFLFSPEGEITGVFAPARYREVGGSYQATPWAGRFRDYVERGGVRIPLQGEVEWRLPQGPLPYWRGRIIAVEYRVPTDRGP